jgi:hypothetical protein
MSLKNLIPYIKSKKCEILGLYSENSVLSFLKLFHMPSKSFFFLNVAYHKINLSVPFENITSDEIYRIGEYEEDFTEELILYFQVLESHLTKHLSNIIFCFGEYIMLDRSKIYKMSNRMVSNYHSPYLCYDLEWFYDNSVQLEHFLYGFQNDVFLKVHQMLNIFLNTFSNLNPMYQIFKEHYNKIEEKRKLYEIIFKLLDEMDEHHTSLTKEYKKQDSYTKVFSIAESENRIFRKKKIREQIQDLLPIKIKTRDTMLTYRNELLHHEIIFLYFIQETKVHMTKLQSLQFEFETKIQR